MEDLKKPTFTTVQIAFGIIAVVAFLFAAIAIFVLPDLRADSTLMTMFATTINNSFLLVIGYWYGSSLGSDKKTELFNLLANLPQTVNIEKNVRAGTVVDNTGGTVDEVINNG